MLQVVVGLPQYPQFLNDAVRAFLKILQDSDPSFIGENNTQVSKKHCQCYIHIFASVHFASHFTEKNKK